MDYMEAIKRAQIWELYAAFLKAEVDNEGLQHDTAAEVMCQGYLTLAEIAVEVWQQHYPVPEAHTTGELQ